MKVQVCPRRKENRYNLATTLWHLTDEPKILESVLLKYESCYHFNINFAILQFNRDGESYIHSDNDHDVHFTGLRLGDIQGETEKRKK